MAKEFRQALAARLAGRNLFICALEQPARAELGELEALNRIAHGSVELSLELACGLRRIFWGEGYIIEVRTSALGLVGSPGRNVEFGSGAVTVDDLSLAF